MKKLQAQKGFTLVELAIVMTIIGLLIGGILKGQELMQNARTTATIAQVRAFEAAATTFRDSYASLPGDLPNASTRVPGCSDYSTFCDVPIATAGNNRVGDPAWDWTTVQASVLSGTNTVEDETTLFWVHLAQADLISGIATNQALEGANPAFGISHPQARIAGGFIVGNVDGATAQPGSTMTAGYPAGLVTVLVNSPTTALGTTTGDQALSAARAQQIDTKMDDGRPSAGSVQAYGVAASCLDGTAPDLNYVGTVTANDCGLIIRIQG